MQKGRAGPALVRHCHHSNPSAEGSNVALGGVGPRCVSIFWDVETLVRGGVYIEGVLLALFTKPTIRQKPFRISVLHTTTCPAPHLRMESLVDGEELMRRFEKFVQAVTQRTMARLVFDYIIIDKIDD